MALVGHPIIGHLVAHRGGHALHTEFAARVLEEQDCWTLVEAPALPATPVPAGRAAPAVN
jgi:UDP-3-O-[3-hydroxymyristoyl] N-acetylglucosamine deacetylase